MNESITLEKYPVPWSFDHMPHPTRPRESRSIVYAQDSSRVCVVEGELSHSLAAIIVDAVNHLHHERGGTAVLTPHVAFEIKPKEEQTQVESAVSGRTVSMRTMRCANQDVVNWRDPEVYQSLQMAGKCVACGCDPQAGTYGLRICQDWLPCCIECYTNGRLWEWLHTHGGI